MKKFHFNKTLTKQMSIAIISLLILVGAVYGITKFQLYGFRQVSALFSGKNGSSTAEQIAALQQEIEQLKKARIEPAPVASPLPDLKTQDELKDAKAQILSLEKQLRQVQTQQSQQPAAVSDADFIKSWNAQKRTVQVACENKLLGTWQLGSGVIISSDGKVLTNQHVVQSSLGIALPDFCLVLFSEDFDNATQKYTKQYRATISGFFSNRDAAMLKISDVIYKDEKGNVQTTLAPGPYAYFPIASEKPNIGDAVWVLGFPESANLAFSVTKGIISNYTSDNLYFGTDAQIDRGNSGGAAVNSSGQLIGLPTYKFSSSGDYRGYILDINSLSL